LLTHPTLDQLHQLGLHSMARVFVSLAANPEATELTHAEWLGFSSITRPATARIGV
jgi:hypothetical protein